MKINWKIKLGAILLLLSVAIYTFAYFYFHEADKVLFYIVIDLAFMPLDVLLVVLIVEGLINKKEKENILEKMDMILSVFFSEVGTEILSKFSKLDSNVDKIRHVLDNIETWSDKDFKKFLREFKNSDYKFDLQVKDETEQEFFIELKQLLVEKREFLIRLLENPNLMEKDSFSTLLLGIFHLDEELEKRDFGYSNIPETDYKHLINDVDRVYSSLIYEWISYLHYLKNHYPYIFSLSIRTNPFNERANIYITE